ncbi:MAG: hypothetical protein ACOZAO_01580 [Patescibacteria group bacterium]
MSYIFYCKSLEDAETLVQMFKRLFGLSQNEIVIDDEGSFMVVPGQDPEPDFLTLLSNLATEIVETQPVYA